MNIELRTGDDPYLRPSGADQVHAGIRFSAVIARRRADPASWRHLRKSRFFARLCDLRLGRATERASSASGFIRHAVNQELASGEGRVTGSPRGHESEIADAAGETGKHGNGVSRSRKPLLMTLKRTLWQQ